MLVQGDANYLPLESESVHSIITSPPYWGHRSYAGVQSRVWGGDSLCDHEWAWSVRVPGMQKDYSTSGLKNDGRPEANRVATLAVEAARRSVSDGEVATGDGHGGVPCGR